MGSAIHVQAVSLAEVMRMTAIPSAYETGAVLRLNASQTDGVWRWELREERLPHRLYKAYDSGDPAEWLESYADIAAQSDLQFLAAGDGASALGLATWVRQRWNETIWLLDIRVLARHRRSGIGSILMKSLIGHAREEGCRGILVETQTTNVPAVRFYQQHGFRLAGFNDRLYANPLPGETGLYLFLDL